MEWSEEKYVKLYQRDTVTWLSWPWQARALWPLLMRKLDGAGLIETGNLQPATAVAMVVGIPVEICEAGIEALVTSGTLVKVERGLLAPKFLEGQEARKSDALRARESRERRRRDANHSESVGPASHAVTLRHETSQPVTLQPSPAQPVPEKTAGEKPPADPRLRSLQERLEQVYGRARGGARYKHGGAKDTLALKALLPVASDDEIARRFDRGLRATGWASCSTFAQLGSKWNDLGAPVERGKGAAWTQDNATDWSSGKGFLEGLGDGR